MNQVSFEEWYKAEHGKEWDREAVIAANEDSIVNLMDSGYEREEAESAIIQNIHDIYGDYCERCGVQEQPVWDDTLKSLLAEHFPGWYTNNKQIENFISNNIKGRISNPGKPYKSGSHSQDTYCIILDYQYTRGYDKGRNYTISAVKTSKGYRLSL